MDKQELFRQALNAEIRSQRLYSSLANSFRHPETSAFFRELVVLEKNHEDKLRAALEQDYPGYVFIVDADINQDFSGLEFTDPTQVLEFAISREDFAHQLYLDLASEADAESLKTLCLRLATEEAFHKDMLLTEMQRIQGALQWFDPSELSGLVED